MKKTVDIPSPMPAPAAGRPGSFLAFLHLRLLIGAASSGALAET